MKTNPNDAIQSLSRIISAAARLSAQMHYSGAAVDPQDEIAHIESNLRHVRMQVEES